MYNLISVILWPCFLSELNAHPADRGRSGRAADVAAISLLEVRCVTTREGRAGRFDGDLLGEAAEEREVYAKMGERCGVVM